MPSNLIHMALDSIIEGAPISSVVDTVLLVEADTATRARICNILSDYGYTGTGSKALTSALNSQATPRTQKTILENKGGAVGTTTHSAYRISSATDCNPDDKTVGEGVIRSMATDTSYSAECELIYPPTTTEDHTGNDKEGVSVLSEYNYPVDNFVVISIQKIPEGAIKHLFKARSYAEAMSSLIARVRHAVPSSKVADVDLVHAPEEAVLLVQVRDRKEAKTLQRALSTILKPLKFAKEGHGSKIDISAFETTTDKFKREPIPSPGGPLGLWNDTVTI